MTRFWAMSMMTMFLILDWFIPSKQAWALRSFDSVNEKPWGGRLFPEKFSVGTTCDRGPRQTARSWDCEDISTMQIVVESIVFVLMQLWKLHKLWKEASESLDSLSWVLYDFQSWYWNFNRNNLCSHCEWALTKLFWYVRWFGMRRWLAGLSRWLRRHRVLPYLWLLQVAVHGLGDISRVDGVVIWVLAVVVFLNHDWEVKR